MLSTGAGLPAFEDLYAERLLVGVPDEDLGAHANAGTVQTYSKPGSGKNLVLTFSGGQQGAERYGRVLNTLG